MDLSVFDMILLAILLVSSFIGAFKALSKSFSLWLHCLSVSFWQLSFMPTGWIGFSHAPL